MAAAAPAATPSAAAGPALRAATLRGVKVYNCSAGKTLPQWYDEAARKGGKSLRYNQEYRTRIELIQDFSFPTASTRVKMSPDQRFILAAGVYSPQIKVFDTEQLAMKFERHVDAEVVQMQYLADDWTKLVLLRQDRTLEFHAQFGVHHKTRIPKYGRSLAYHFPSCDLHVVGSTHEVFRLNLEQGRFLAPLQTSLPAINVVGFNPVNQLLGLGGENGALECWDPRVRQCVASLVVSDSLATVDARLSARLSESPAEVSALRFADDGLTMALGLSSGHVLLYDIRSSHPLFVRDHRYGLPIRSVKFHPCSSLGRPKVVSLDGKIIKIWDKATGELFTSIESLAEMNHLCLAGDTGLLFAAAEQHRILCYYIPQLGRAPRWCAWLDNLTEELEESQQINVVYDDYKFVTREELESWGVSHLIGSNVLRAYMHGFFMDIRLYNRIRAVAEPMVYDDYVKERVRRELDERGKGRITVQNKLPPVNREYAKALLQEPRLRRQLREIAASVDGHAGAGGTDAAGAAELAESVHSNPLQDSRFRRLFTNPEYAIEPGSEEYQRLHPSLAGSNGRPDDRFVRLGGASAAAATDDDDAEEDEESSDSDDEGARVGARGVMGRLAASNSRESSSEDENEGETQAAPEMYEARDGLGLSQVLRAPSESEARQREFLRSLPLNERLALQRQLQREQQEREKQAKQHQVRQVEAALLRGIDVDGPAPASASAPAKKGRKERRVAVASRTQQERNHKRHRLRAREH